MDNYFSKFAFLIVMIGVVLFSRMAYPAATPATFAEVSGVESSAQNGEVPIFVLPPITVSAQGGMGNASGAGSTSGASGTDANIPASLSAKVAQPPVLHDAALLAADLKTGTVYGAVNADRRWPTASLTKLMSGTIIEDKFDPNTRIAITENMFAADPQEQTLVVGGTYTVSDLLHLMLLPSSNVAAEAVATFYGRDAFLSEMNARAAAWGMEDTHFNDPSGISAGDQSTANDFLKLAQKIYAGYPQIFQITRALQFSITEQGSSKKILIKSINSFAGGADFVGGKTGHTDEAGGNLLSVFRDGSRTFFIVVLGSDDRFGDTRKLHDWLEANFK